MKVHTPWKLYYDLSQNFRKSKRLQQSEQFINTDIEISDDEDEINIIDLVNKNIHVQTGKSTDTSDLEIIERVMDQFVKGAIIVSLLWIPALFGLALIKKSR
jgi:hypothetical protein